MRYMLIGPVCNLWSI